MERLASSTASPDGSNTVSGPAPALKATRSFTRLEPQTSDLSGSRSRSSTFSSLSAAGVSNAALDKYGDANINYDPPESLEGALADGEPEQEDDIHDDTLLAELPPEILNLTNSFIESLSAKVHPAPVSIELLSDMFQDFYDTAASSISSYVAKLYSKIGTAGSDQQLVSMSEIMQRKKDRKRKDVHRSMLLEACERRATESVFDRIWRHHSSEDEARDEALRSKTMALAVIGIGLRELGLEENINVMDLQPVCQFLQNLNNSKCPRDKLSLLKAAHKAIVDVLTKLVSATSSSADHILPILIYSLIISPPNIDIISNLLYIQRFRYHRSLDGEAAYCLTNLEAAISFLETIDMATLSADSKRIDMTEQMQETSSESNEVARPHPGTSATGTSNKAPVSTGVLADTSATAQFLGATDKTSVNHMQIDGPMRRISYFTPVEFATSAATTAVNTADQSLKTIGNSLESSYKFLFGKLSDKRTELPKTLEDVRRLVGTPSEEREIERSLEDQISKDFGGIATNLGEKREQIEGNPSQDGARSHSTNPTTGLKVVQADKRTTISTAREITELPSATPVADSVRNIGSQLGKFAGNINVMRGFSRNQVPKTPPPPAQTQTKNMAALPRTLDQDVMKLEPPIQHFLDTEAADLKLRDVEILLQDYRRLVSALKAAGIF